MKSQKYTTAKIILFAMIAGLITLTSPINAGEKPWVVIRDNIPQEIERFNIEIKFNPASSRFYDSSSHGIKSKEIEDARKKDDYKQQLDLGTAVDGNHYVMMVKDSSDVDIISQNSDRLMMVKVLRMKDSKKPETVKEGLMTLHRNLEIPLEVSPEQLSIPSTEPIKGRLEVNLYSSSYPAFEGRCQVTLNGTLSGSTSTEQALLDASLTCGDSLELNERNISLSLKPFDDSMAPASCRGKLSDTLMLGSAKLVVEKIRSDCSEVVLAHLDGDMVQEKKRDTSTAMVGKAFPPFARVELFKRQLMTLDDLKEEADADGYIVLIFGDFKMQLPPYYGGRPPMRNLSLDEMMISDILKKDCDNPIVITFICQQLAMADLYEKWLGKVPEFYVLSDFSNPLNTQFVGTSTEPHMMYPQSREETLRGKLKLDPQKVITALIDGNGNLIYLNTDAGNELAGSLTHINKLIKEGKKAETQD